MAELDVTRRVAERVLNGDGEALRAPMAALGLGTAEVDDLCSAVTAAAADPLADVAMRVAYAGTEIMVEGWISEVLVLVVPNTDPATDAAQVLVDVPLALPRLVATLIGLGPRPSTDTPVIVPVPRAMADALCGIGWDDDAPTSLVEAVGDLVDEEVLETLFDGEAVRWTLSVLATARLGDGLGAGADVLDAGPRGIWQLLPTEEEERIAVVRTDTPSVWAQLASVLSLRRSQVAERES